MLQEGTLRLGRKNESQGSWAVNYLKRAQLEDLQKGVLSRKGVDEQGAGVFEYGENASTKAEPGTIWVRDSHDASIYGSTLLRSMIPGRTFPFPKSLYAVEDSLRFVLADNPDALVIDFFAGSGTTGHALMRLNREDGGNRRFVLVTNNEVSDTEASQMRKSGLAPGDDDWESLGIYQYVTRPRIEAAVSGKTPDGKTLEGEYKFSNEYPMAEGFEENVEFLELQYLDPNNVSRGKVFEKIAPLIWMKAGAGKVMLIEERPDFSIAENSNYAILFNLEKWQDFVIAVRGNPVVRHVFVITDSRASYQQVIQELDSDLNTTMLYEDYLRNFEISIGGQ
jgi:adenine-specific DNA-methyltransferase